ncbi:zinc finger protein 260 [Diachasma alloeum]|uniref:zinc finger protein 260 n=1 Tax=Diachasma alloeum TaxID=454923 RepID=UPI0007384DF2|nr:zinc finger protein 260 [Diachasma alloeum]
MSVVDEFDYLCRLCATKTEILVGLPIFEHGENLRNIDKKITECLPIQVSMTDELPKVVCEECAYKLDDIIDFREKCRQTEDLFNEMLKGIKSDVDIRDSLPDCASVIPEISQDISRLHDSMAPMDTTMTHPGIPSIEPACPSPETNTPGGLHTMQVMDEMDLAGGEQVVSQEEIPRQEELEITELDPLDVETVGIVGEHISQEAVGIVGDQISMHLEGEMTVVEHLGINYVTAIGSDSPNQEQIVHYCNNVKYQEVKENYMAERLTVGADVTSDGFPQEEAQGLANRVTPVTNESGEVAGTSGDQLKNGIREYTKHKKHSLLRTTLNNPTIDDTGTSWYVCPLCNEAATEANDLAEHFKQHFYSCNCGLLFTHVDDLNGHKERGCKKRVRRETSGKMERAKGPEEVSEVSAGDEESGRKTQSSVRQKWTPKVCAQCGKQYRTNYKLQEHMRKHTGEKPFQCLLCDKAFRSKIGLAQHTATHTGQFDYSCSTCGKGFQCKSYLIVHQRVHSDLKPYPCSTCGQNFKTKQSLLDHQNRHLGVKPYVCEICGRGFITKGLCKSHQRIHSGTDNRQYPCEVCNKMFVSKSYLNTHLRIHTGEKPYLCEVCGKGFLTRVDLKIHSTMHTGEKSFKCEVCNKVFARRAALRCHRRSHTGERPYRCDVCGKTFTQFSPMAIHKRLHTGERPYECDVCGKAFVSRSTMMTHKKKHHLPATGGDKAASGDINVIIVRETPDGIAIGD